MKPALRRDSFGFELYPFLWLIRAHREEKGLVDQFLLASRFSSDSTKHVNSLMFDIVREFSVVQGAHLIKFDKGPFVSN